MKKLQEMDPQYTSSGMLDQAKKEKQMWLEWMSWCGSRDQRLCGWKNGAKTQNFFHTKVSSRRIMNRLITLQYDAGEWIEESQLDTLSVDYFKSVFSATMDKRHGFPFDSWKESYTFNKWGINLRICGERDSCGSKANAPY